jgi:MGT family glycosyltransferase
MNNVLIATVPVYGHVKPLIPIARELIKRGHQVCWYTGAQFRKTIEDNGCQFEPIQSWMDYSIEANVPDELAQARSSLKGVEQLKFDLKNLFIQPMAGQVKDLQTILNRFEADVILTDSFFKGASLLHELGGPMWAEYGVTAFTFSSKDTAPFGLGLQPNPTVFGKFRNKSLSWLTQKLVFQDTLVETNAIRSQLNLAKTHKPFFDDISPFLYLAGTVPSLEYPRRDLPPQVHFVGPYLPEAPSTDDKTPWDIEPGMRNTTIVHITQGTIATEPQNLIIPALEALKNENISIIVATGIEPSAELLNSYCKANIRIEGFIPYHRLLPYVNLMVTNGGYNGVQAALSHGIPLIVAGQTEDKREVNARVSWSGAGIDLKTNQPKPNDIKLAFKKITSSPTYLTQARRLQNEMRSFNQASLSANLLEKLLETKAPVY